MICFDLDNLKQTRKKSVDFVASYKHTIFNIQLTWIALVQRNVEWGHMLVAFLL